MRSIPLCMVLALTLVSCTDTAMVDGEYAPEPDIDREVVSAKTPAGRAFHFMPIADDGVDRIMITSAWPTHWAYQAHNNPAVPDIAAEAIMSRGTKDLAPEEVLDFFNDRNALGRLFIQADHVIGELSFPKEHLDDIVSMTSELLSNPQFDPASVERIKKGLSAKRMKERAEKRMEERMADIARLAILGDEPLADFLSADFLNSRDIEAIEGIKVDDLRRWHEETIVGSDLTIAVAGAITRQEAGKAIDRLLSKLPDGKDRRPAPAVQADFWPKTILLHTPEASTSMLGFFGRISSFAEGGDMTDLLAVNLLARRGQAIKEALTGEAISGHVFKAELIDYDRSIRLMHIGVSGEFEDSTSARVALSILRRYEAYRSDPDLSEIDRSKREIADLFHRYLQDVDALARTILQSALREGESGEPLRLDRGLETIEAEDVRDRLGWAFPASRDLIIVAITADADALPGACVITEVEQAASCSPMRY